MKSGFVDGETSMYTHLQRILPDFSYDFPIPGSHRGIPTAPWSPRGAPISKALGRSGQRRTPPAEEILARGGAKGWGSMGTVHFHQ